MFASVATSVPGHTLSLASCTPWPVLVPGNSSVPHHQLGSYCCDHRTAQRRRRRLTATLLLLLLANCQISFFLAKTTPRPPSLPLGPSTTLHGQPHHLRDEDQEAAEMRSTGHPPSRHSHSAAPPTLSAPLRSPIVTNTPRTVLYSAARPAPRQPHCTLYTRYTVQDRHCGRTGRLPSDTNKHINTVPSLLSPAQCSPALATICTELDLFPPRVILWH